MVKSHANTVALALTVKIPNTQVSPSNGTNTMEAMKMALQNSSFIERNIFFTKLVLKLVLNFLPSKCYMYGGGREGGREGPQFIGRTTYFAASYCFVSSSLSFRAALLTLFFHRLFKPRTKNTTLTCIQGRV